MSSSTMSGGSRFQSLTVLGKNYIFLVSIRQNSIWNALLCVFLERRQGGISLFSLVTVNTHVFFLAWFKVRHDMVWSIRNYYICIWLYYTYLSLTTALNMCSCSGLTVSSITRVYMLHLQFTLITCTYIQH